MLDTEDTAHLFTLLERIAIALERLESQDTRLDALSDTINVLCERTAVKKPTLLTRPHNPKLEIKR